MKISVMLGRPTGDGTENCSVGNLCDYVQDQNHTTLKDIVGSYINCPVRGFPTDICRNTLVQQAQQNSIGYLFMVDTDMEPCYDFYPSALKFLINHHEPSIIGSPYCSGDGRVLVYDFTSDQDLGTGDVPWRLREIGREDAVRRTGVERIANIGTGWIAYDMRVFQHLSKPFYKYTYNQDHTQVIETEECYLHRRLFHGDDGKSRTKIYCDWDRWSSHYKVKKVGRPVILTHDYISKLHLDQAKAEVRMEQNRELNESIRNGSSARNAAPYTRIEK